MCWSSDCAACLYGDQNQNLCSLTKPKTLHISTGQSGINLLISFSERTQMCVISQMLNYSFKITIVTMQSLIKSSETTRLSNDQPNGFSLNWDDCACRWVGVYKECECGWCTCMWDYVDCLTCACVSISIISLGMQRCLSAQVHISVHSSWRAEPLWHWSPNPRIRRFLLWGSTSKQSLQQETYPRPHPWTSR